jgi:hypothetical protein
MSKLILFSLLVAAIAIPAQAARIKSPSKGLKKALIAALIFDAFYGFALIFLWGRC